MFVRTKKVGEREYHQLVENYRENGKHRQRVVVHLGGHGTVEDALEDARDKLAAMPESKLAERVGAAERRAEYCEGQLRRHFADALDRYHPDGIPTDAEVAALMDETTYAPDTDEVAETFYGFTTYMKEKRERTPEQLAYCRAFMFDWIEEEELDRPDRYGHTTEFPGNDAYRRWVEEYHYWKDRAAYMRAEYERKERKLRDRIAKLESVVTKTRTRPRSSSTV
jgi:hypothetical protein